MVKTSLYPAFEFIPGYRTGSAKDTRTTPLYLGEEFPGKAGITSRSPSLTPGATRV